MKATDIKKDGIYVIRHHDGFLHKVRVLALVTRKSYGGYLSSEVRHMTHYLCLKLSTGRTIEVKSAAKFRSEVTL